MGRRIGITGRAPEIPYLKQLTTLRGVMQGYRKIDAWFLPLSLNPGTLWMANMIVCQLTVATIKSWVTVSVTTHFMALLTGFIYMPFFWQLALMPSVMYPTPAIMWPIQAMNQLVWITRPAEYDIYAISSPSRFSELSFLSPGLYAYSFQ